MQSKSYYFYVLHSYASKKKKCFKVRLHAQTPLPLICIMELGKNRASRMKAQSSILLHTYVDIL